MTKNDECESRSQRLGTEVNKKQVKAGAPTGIAAANIEIEGTDVVGQTIHSLFDLDNEYKSPPRTCMI